MHGSSVNKLCNNVCFGLYRLPKLYFGSPYWNLKHWWLTDVTVVPFTFSYLTNKHSSNTWFIILARTYDQNITKSSKVPFIVICKKWPSISKWSELINVSTYPPTNTALSLATLMECSHWLQLKTNHCQIAANRRPTRL